MFDPNRPFRSPADSAADEYDRDWHGWLDERPPAPFEVSAAAIAAGLGGILALGIAIAAVHEAGRRI